jgi:hypothetical protein
LAAVAEDAAAIGNGLGGKGRALIGEGGNGGRRPHGRQYEVNNEAGKDKRAKHPRQTIHIVPPLVDMG